MKLLLIQLFDFIEYYIIFYSKFILIRYFWSYFGKVLKHSFFSWRVFHEGQILKSGWVVDQFR